ncbi:hypothetical protein F511_01739 [Dorcoceras hygrometricum]|uniref:Myb/SANT-like domain-containing protein n=1 Tax=Dorcoceras hygrometricum TaxID=472368 RepID=A0A2Z7AY91_9LAMI|nr:hypothetical protein F511_01739 [Dorcoceras hygrometricum]
MARLVANSDPRFDQHTSLLSPNSLPRPKPHVEGCTALKSNFGMESGDTCGSVIGQVKKVEKTRRTWTSREEEVLLTSLKDVITKGARVEEKVQYISNVIRQSGVGWNDTDNTVEATDETWDAIIKTDSTFRSMRHKQWTHYADWCEIFGNDRATGEQSQTFENALKDVLKLNDNVPNQIGGGEAYAFKTSVDDDDSISETHTPSSKPNAATSSKKRKRKQLKEVDDAIVAAINNLADITKVAMNDLVKQLAAPDILSDAQDVVLESLRGMSELSEDEQVIAAQLLFNNHNNLALFKRLNPRGRLSLVRRLLGGD